MRLCICLLLVSIVLYVLSGYKVVPEWVPLGTVAQGVQIAIVIAMVCMLLYFKCARGGKLNVPYSPEGNPVRPSGQLIDEATPLGIGSHVLAHSPLNGQWHRAVVTGFKRDGRVCLHFPGWYDYWDEVLPRSRLQVDTMPADPNTSIRRG
jgi:hypothetical protein